jgi:hypothetical protein
LSDETDFATFGYIFEIWLEAKISVAKNLALGECENEASFVPRVELGVRSCDISTLIRCTPILIWGFSKKSAIWSILIQK